MKQLNFCRGTFTLSHFTLGRIDIGDYLEAEYLGFHSDDSIGQFPCRHYELFVFFSASIVSHHCLFQLINPYQFPLLERLEIGERAVFKSIPSRIRGFNSRHLVINEHIGTNQGPISTSSPIWDHQP